MDAVKGEQAAARAHPVRIAVAIAGNDMSGISKRDTALATKEAVIIGFNPNSDIVTMRSIARLAAAGVPIPRIPLRTSGPTRLTLNLPRYAPAPSNTTSFPIEPNTAGNRRVIKTIAGATPNNPIERS
ncbi:hypothetical protein HMEPL2_29720 [Vreelandella aquamarina]|uniref:Uncharacterized protein n=1 Tax=Vreelandella aquamarina TaxID=77097 RepID=A0A6F8XE06_9GAMM|nr:hypothetical protein HMEPL2_29720 [Halomonas meridiana]